MCGKRLQKESERERLRQRGHLGSAEWSVIKILVWSQALTVQSVFSMISRQLNYSLFFHR